MNRPTTFKLGNDNNYTRSVWRIPWDLRHFTKPWEKGIEPQCHKYETDRWFKYLTSVNMNFKSFHMHRLENKNLQCFLHPLVLFFWLPLHDAIKKECLGLLSKRLWGWTKEVTLVFRVCWHHCVRSSSSCLKFKCRNEKKEDGVQKKRLTPVLLHSISRTGVQSCAKTRTAIYFIGIVTAMPLRKGYINWEVIKFDIWEGSEREAVFGENKVE